VAALADLGEAAYIAKLHEQAASIKNLLKLLNAGSASGGARSAASLVGEEEASVYEPLWEAGGEQVQEAELSGEEEMEEREGEESFYENTGVSKGAPTVGVEHPPPLPPRLPTSAKGLDLRGLEARSLDGRGHGVRSGDSSVLDLSQVPTPRLSGLVGATSTPRHLGDTSSTSSRHLGDNSSSTSRNLGERQAKLQELGRHREELIGELQSEERERQWHYTQLELISQKLRSLPLTSSLSVSTCRCAG